jgi:predicted peptidase
MRYILIIALLMVSTVSLDAKGKKKRKKASAKITSEESWMSVYKTKAYEQMPYRLMKPVNFDESKRYPVIISLHGGSGKGTDNRQQLLVWTKQLAEEKVRTDYPCYIVAPQSEGHWNKTHLDRIKAVIKELPSVDMKRIYILGHSMGGYGTYIFTQIDPGYFAAAAPSAGSGLKTTEDFIDPSVIKDLPVWSFHGDKDGKCPFAKGLKVFEEMKIIGGNMKFTTWKGGSHSVADKFIAGADNGTTEVSSDKCDPENDFLKWLFKQRR